MSDVPPTLQYKVLVLGSMNAGKTTFLSAMFRTLCLPRPETGFILETDLQSADQLGKRYQSIIDGVFPAGTTAIDEWHFNCLVAPSNSKAKYKVMEITYYDYAGGRLIDSQSPDLPRLMTYIEEADALLIILDGLKLHHLIQGRIGPKDLFDKDLLYIFQYIQKSMAPIHFIITKWDVLKPRYSFETIRNRLFSHPDFHAIAVYASRSQSILRLIPVSAVGLEAFELQADDTMKLVPGKTVWPLYADYPLSCILIDQFATKIMQHLRTQKIQLKSKSPTVFIQRLGLKMGAIVAGGFVELLQGASVPLPLLASAVSVKTLLGFVELLQANAAKRRADVLKKAEQMRKKQKESLESVENLQTAMNYAVERCLYIGYKLEQDFPGSVLLPEENKGR